MDACVIDWQAVSGMGSMVVAGLALVYTVRETKKAARERTAERIAAADQRAADREAEDKERRLMVRPALTGTWDVDQREHSLKYTLRNMGVGPARIMASFPVYRGQAVTELDLQKLLDDFDVSMAEPGHYCPRIMPGTMMLVGEGMVLLDLTFIDVPDDFDVLDVRNAIHYEADYRSIYGDEYSTRTEPL